VKYAIPTKFRGQTSFFLFSFLPAHAPIVIGSRIFRKKIGLEVVIHEIGIFEENEPGYMA